VQRLGRIAKIAISCLDRTGADTGAGRAAGEDDANAAIASDLLCQDAPFRQYVALDGEEVVGRVRSVDAVGATWCADM